MPKDEKTAKAESPTIEQLEKLADTDSGPDTVRDALNEAIEEHGGTLSISDGPAKEAAPAESVDDKKDEKKAAEGDGEAEDKTKEAEEKKDSADAEKAAVIEPPAEWSASEHEAFRALPPEGQKFVIERVGKASNEAKKASETLERLSGVEKVLAPRRAMFERDGYTDEQGLRQLFALSDYAMSKPAEFLQWFAKQRGLDLTGLVPKPAAAQADDPYADDPVVQTLRAELKGVKDELAGLMGVTQKMTGTITEREQREKQAADQEVDNHIIAFREAKDEEGKPKHPHFDQVRVAMGALMTTKGPDGKYLASDTETAYTMACRAHPDVFAKIESARKAKETQEQAKAAREKAAAARKTGSSVSGMPGPHQQPAPTGNIRSDLAAAFAADGGVRL